MKQNSTISLLMLAACVGWTMAVPFPGVSRPYLAIVSAGTILVGAGFRMIDASRVRWLAAGETMAVIAVPVVAFAVGSIAASIDEASLLAGLLASFAVWLLGAITITDIEAVTEPTDLVEGMSGALGRITTRLMLVGIALMVALVAGHGGLSPVTVARPIKSGLVVPFLIYWIGGISGLASLNRSRLVARWKRDRSRIDDDLSERWRTAAGFWLAASTSLAVAWWWVGRAPLDVAHGLVAGGLRGLTSFFGRLLNVEQTAANPSGVSVTTVVTPPPSGSVNPVTPPPEWFDLFLLLAAGAVFAFAFVVFQRRVKARGTSGSRVLWSALRAMWTTLWGFLTDLVRLVRSLFRGRAGGGAAGDRWRRAAATSPPAWSPTDPWRRRIAAEYRAFLVAARERVGPIPGTETPSELARRIEGAEASTPALGILTRIYEVARFSAQTLDETAARQAQEARLVIVASWEEPD
jgi:hypothetical protein